MALLWTLEQGLGAAFTPEVRQAWSALYTLVADTMKAAARHVQATPGGQAAPETHLGSEADAPRSGLR